MQIRAFAASVVDMSADPTQPDRSVSFGTGADLPFNRPDDERVFERAISVVERRLPAAVSAWIDAHVLEHLHDPAAIEFVRGLVIASDPLNVYSASRIAVASSGLVSWAHLSEGLPLRRNVLLSQQVTEMYLQHLLRTLSAGTVRNYRGYLERVATAVGAVVSERPMSIPGKKVAAPYSPEQEKQFGVWARTVVTELGVARAMALLGLVAGAGLRNEELPLVRVADVIDEAGMWIRVHGAVDRLTPVRQEWAPYLRRRIEELDRAEFVFPPGGPVAARGIQAWQIGPDRTPHPVPNRLRSTWIVTHLRADVPPESLLAWSGITRGETIANYLQFLPDATEGTRRTYMHLDYRIPRKVHAS